MKVHFGMRFDNETVEMDDGEFENCTFVDCRLVFRGKEPPILWSNTLVRCEWALEDAALRTVGFLAVLHMSGDTFVDAIIDMIRGTRVLPERPKGPIQ